MTETEQDNLNTTYNHLCISYHKVDDFRAKILGFLPLASGVAMYGLLDPNSQDAITKHLNEIGVFGVFVNLGLLVVELKEVQKCTAFIFDEAAIEKELFASSSLVEMFTGLSNKKRGYPLSQSQLLQQLCTPRYWPPGCLSL